MGNGNTLLWHSKPQAVPKATGQVALHIPHIARIPTVLRPSSSLDFLVLGNNNSKWLIQRR